MRRNQRYYEQGGGGGGGGGYPWAEQQQPSQQYGVYPRPEAFVNSSSIPYYQNFGFLPQFSAFSPNPSNILPQFQQPFPDVGPSGQKFQPFPNAQKRDKAQNEMVEKMDKAAKNAWAELLELKKNVSAWEVSQAALLMVNVDSWESLGFQMQQVPSISHLLAMEWKINAFIHCFVAARRITSLYDLEVAICENEGVKQFKELGLGPLLQHPLVIHYFSLGPETTEVHKVRTEAIISHLCDFIETHRGEGLEVCNFLDFLSKKESVTSMEKLCIRLHGFRFYVNHITRLLQHEGRLAEGISAKIRLKSTRTKKELDGNFKAISQRVKSFSASAEFCGQHIRFPSSCSEDDECEDKEHPNAGNSGSNCCVSLPNVGSDRVRSCPYPSAIEEITRLAMKSSGTDTNLHVRVMKCTADGELPQRKRASSSDILPYKQAKRAKPKSGNKASNHLIVNPLSHESLQTFVTTWKDACREHTGDTVLEMMLRYYKPKKPVRVKRIFTSTPFGGLFSAAVAFIRLVSPNNVHKISQSLSRQDVGKVPQESADAYLGDAKVVTEINCVSKAENQTCKPDARTEDILMKISEYFKVENEINSYEGSSNRCNLHLLRKLCMSESWLTEVFSVDKFESLGHGDYFMFLDKHVHQLPHGLQSFMIGGVSEGFSLEAHLLPIQLDMLISQAVIGSRENEALSLQSISNLLTRQFPLACFKLVKGNLTENFAGNFQEKTGAFASSCVYFSTPLLGLGCNSNSSAQFEKKTVVDVCSNVKIEERMFDPVTSSDAIRALVKAPMLVDLRLWLHWDIVFAPSLGSFMEWLLKNVRTKDFLCLVTKDGSVVRINHLASIDSFMKVFIQGSSFKTAVELLSIIATYGGQHSVPVALIKSHAQKAFQVLLQNYKEKEPNVNSEVRWDQSSDDHDTSLNGNFCNLSFKPSVVSALSEAAPTMSKFVLECLSYMPIEFCSFATDILISGLRPYVVDASKAILTECKQMHERLMLHDVGMALGISEWVNDYNSFSSSVEAGSFPACLESDFNVNPSVGENEVNFQPSLSGEILLLQDKENGLDVSSKEILYGVDSANAFINNRDSEEQLMSDGQFDDDPAKVIESIRKEEFGLDSSLSASENKMLEKQHSRLGRALRCISQELYSEGSHFLLELVQNADDNIYPHNVVPMLVFILQERSIAVLNNEKGFSTNDIRALCDVGNSTKRNHKAEYIGKKGIGFKSVFCVTDAPEIHSNGFHIKFDITQGQIGFILPTVVPPHDIQLYTRLASSDADCMDKNAWNTCIVLPLKSNLSEVSARNSVFTMFSSPHPSLLLFLRRLQCIKFKNTLDDTCVVMRKKVRGNGIVQVSINGDEMTWFVVSHKLKDVIHSDLHTSSISVAFTLREMNPGEYTSVLNQQPVFAFLPLRTYGLKFILQGDFVLPSSREDIDGSNPWNQWLLSEVPDLFVRAGRLFCDLPCYRDFPGKAVSLFMKYVPMVGEVHGFFSSLPQLIISKLRMSSCLLLEDDKQEWVPPFRALRNWDEQARSLLPSSLLHKHLGMGFLDKDIVLSDTLARALGVENYGPAVLLRVLSSLCSADNGLCSMGLEWLASWLGNVYVMLFKFSQNESDFILDLKKIPFIPLGDGKYSSLNEGIIWLHYDAVGQGTRDDLFLKEFPILLTKLRFVSPKLLSAASLIENSGLDMTMLESVKRMLLKVGVQRVSAHDILKEHVLPALSDYKTTEGEKGLIVEYLAFAMFHLHSSCSTCGKEREDIVNELRTKTLILTNFGHKRMNEVPIHFNSDFMSPVDIRILTNGADIKWHEIDSSYLEHPITKSASDGILKWRKFFLEIGATDFVKVVEDEKQISDVSSVNFLGSKDFSLTKTVVKDWKSEELFLFLSALSSSTDDCPKSKCLLEVLDKLWDEHFGDKVTGCCIDCSGNSKPFKSSFISMLQDFPWMCSTMGKNLSYPKDLYHDCPGVNSILGVCAPYAAPKVRSEKLIADIGLKTEVTLDDALSVLRLWRSYTPLRASVSQMNNFYTFIWKEVGTSKKAVIEELCLGPFIFIPNATSYSPEDVVPGTLFSSQEVYWNDSNNQVSPLHTKSITSRRCHSQRKMLCALYQNLHDFFVDECGVPELPPLCSYLQFLQHLSNTALPHEAAKKVSEVFLIWGDALKSGTLSFQDIEYLKENLLKKECTVLPTINDKWVSLHSSYGLICWCDDDDDLESEFRYLEGVEFIYFGESTSEVKHKLGASAFTVMRTLGIPSISEIVTREAIYYGPANSSFFHSLVNWSLPYAQRYIHKMHAEKYTQLKVSNFTKIRHLKVKVVEKLLYRNVIKSRGISSTKRTETSCLHQGDILYCTPKSDPHSIFLELSCLLYTNSPDLLFANFLHMITTMAESGATEEQTEFFILNSQKVPTLPDEECIWSLQSSSSLMENDSRALEDRFGIRFNEQKPVISKRTGVNPNWPPADWKTAPGFKSAASFASKKSECSSLPVIERNTTKDFEQACIPTAIRRDYDADPAEDDNKISDSRMNTIPLGSNVVVDSVDVTTVDSRISALDCDIKDQVQTDHTFITGRCGELVAYKHFAEKVGEGGSVKWVNETVETGLPYDIVVGEENEREYIEVKATKSNSKTWFFISMKEWEFAVEKGESFSIAHVVLANNDMARITIYKNPARLWQLGNLKLAAVPTQ